MIEQLRYHTIAELQALSLAELRAMWELVPTDRQRAYRAAYEREVRTAGAVGSDALERQVAAELLRRYDETALVPVGSRWARTPGRVQAAAKQNDALAAPEDETRPSTGSPSPRIALVVGLAALLIFGFLFVRLTGSRSPGDDADGAPVGGVAAAQTVTPAPGATLLPTATPLALEAQDDVIRGGDGAREVAYPVNLQVITETGSSPRVWVVQRRAVRAAEWNYDPNPDIAAFVSGMSVRPVIGIPWSQENAAFFAGIDTGTSFLLTMNTGAVLRYDFEGKREVRRSETGIFRQVSPGLVLLLIGETGDDGLPTATRTLVTAAYPPEQELSRDGQALGMNVTVQEGSAGDRLLLGEASITLRNVRLLTDAPDLPPEMQYLLLDFDATAGAETLDTTTWRMEVVDAGGQVYTVSGAALAHADYAALPVEIPALSSLTASVGYVVPRSLHGGRWLVTDVSGSGVSFSLSLAAPPPDLRYDGVDVRLVSVTTIEGQITTRLRIYNGQTTPLTFTPDDIWLALGYAPDPPGPRNPAEGMQPFDLLPEQAVDLTLVWYWADEPYASLGVGEYRFAIQVHRQ